MLPSLFPLLSAIFRSFTFMLSFHSAYFITLLRRCIVLNPHTVKKVVLDLHNDPVGEVGRYKVVSERFLDWLWVRSKRIAINSENERNACISLSPVTVIVDN